MSQTWPEDEPDPDKEDLTPPRELTPEEQTLAFRAQIILFMVMGVFIITPFILWWWLSTRQ